MWDKKGKKKKVPRRGKIFLGREKGRGGKEEMTA